MKWFKVVLHKKALRELESLSLNTRDRIIESLREMEVDPSKGAVKPLKGIRGVFRRRVGAYRINFHSRF